ncbi:MAG: Mrp/NBP35 family ATP-binding protein [Acidimicrobiia bacterium]|nr:Mrp/NBP35 family ATP-binding protein [Acidimicrobiia bacterium]MBT8217969.1 Mrp/NBP35 family ATP-binding protein [Acidimicrobiia bacterium]NNF11325.1 Mrp/NBP35 family ATP-binding protein [Acidimicrobiia bacterium]NNL70705.1 Mrp/NBP35 family ATP-binding protein [Acidimicrobiia bacterium]
MSTTTDIEQALRGVVDPELGGDIVELGMVKGIELTNGIATIRVALTIAACPMRSQIDGDVRRKVAALPGVDDVVVEMGEMTADERSAVMSKARFRARENAEPTMIDPVTRVVAVSSGKGGVGKSSVSVNLALGLTAQGFTVGLLDADIWGFSIPRMLGVGEKRLGANTDGKIVPLEAQGLKLVSTGLLVDDEDKALMWRGLMLSKALEQFLTDVAWGHIDYLVVDMPPGTGDIQMALARLLPQAEMVVVTTPQKTAQKVAARVADMARRSFMPVIGVIENMAGFTTPSGEHFKLFGEGGGQELADELGVPLIASIPLDPYVVEGGDAGAPVATTHPESPAGMAVLAGARRLTELLPPAEDETCTARIDRLLDALPATK